MHNFKKSISRFDVAVIIKLLSSSIPGLSSIPQVTCVRSVIGSWWIFSLIITVIYASNLTAHLTVRKIHLPINSLEELANSSVIINAQANSAAVDILKYSKDKYLRDIYETNVKICEDTLPRTVTEQIKETLNDKNSVALIVHKYFKYMNYQPAPYNELQCEFVLANVRIYWNLGGFPIRKGSKYGIVI